MLLQVRSKMAGTSNRSFKAGGELLEKHLKKLQGELPEIPIYSNMASKQNIVRSVY